jgi:LPXTG-motif cell wall-anchored protein
VIPGNVTQLSFQVEISGRYEYLRCTQVNPISGSCEASMITYYYALWTDSIAFTNPDLPPNSSTDPPSSTDGSFLSTISDIYLYTFVGMVLIGSGAYVYLKKKKSQKNQFLGMGDDMGNPPFT